MALFFRHTLEPKGEKTQAERNSPSIASRGRENLSNASLLMRPVQNLGLPIWASSSITKTRKPLFTSCIEIYMPTGPAPITTISYLEFKLTPIVSKYSRVEAFLYLDSDKKLKASL